MECVLSRMEISKHLTPPVRGCTGLLAGSIDICACWHPLLVIMGVVLLIEASIETKSFDRSIR